MKKKKCKSCNNDFIQKTASAKCAICLHEAFQKKQKESVIRQMKKRKIVTGKKTVKKKKSTLQKLRKKCENRAKLCAKIRDKYTCQKCYKKVEGANAHGSHVIPVSAGNQFRFDEKNIKTLCYHCHINWWHKNPIEASEWFKKTFPERYKYLFGKTHKSVKYSEQWYMDKIEELDKKIEKLKTY